MTPKIRDRMAEAVIAIKLTSRGPIIYKQDGIADRSCARTFGVSA